MVGTYDFKVIEKEIRENWRKIDLLKKIQEQNKEGEPYFLLDGPPYANNVPHVGHIRNTVYKDFYIRQAMMEGKNVLFQPGFDTHGLPIENVVEKKLGLKSKKDITKLGIKKFCDTCKDVAIEYKDVWINVYDKLGSWYSWKDPYITYHNNYLESVWWSFKRMWEKGMVYEGKKPVFWCPKCETALAGYETTDSYTNVQDPLIIVKFKVKGTQNDYLLVFTTTPWTLPSNVIIAAKEDGVYLKVKTKEGNLILAKNLIKLLDDLELEYEILDEFKGKKLEGLEYESLLDVPAQQELQKNPRALKVYMSIPILKERLSAKVAAKLGKKAGDVFEDFVSVDDGTGLVHCAPGHGKTDNLVGIHYDLPEISPLDDRCRFTDEAGIYQGKFVKDADEQIIGDLKNQGKMLYNHKLTHSYPLCWRCKSPLIFRMSNQWFLKTDVIKKQMLKANENVTWQPDFAGERFHQWVANAEDWNFSRQRFWGIPIPIWKSEEGDLKVIGSIKELEEELGKKLPEDFDLHTVGELKLKSENGTEMKTIGDIFDVWYDSGSAPYAAFHYPFENKEIFESHYPVNRINEAQDQVRGWFYSLMFCGIGAIGKPPYKTISMPAWVVDKDGEKMSKSLGNFISAEDAMDNYGADNVRFYYCSDVDPSSTARFNPETVSKETSRVHGILWNLHKLLITQVQAEIANGSDIKLTKDISKLKLQTEDFWLLSRLSTTIIQVKKDYNNFILHQAGRAMNDFVINDLSRTYIQLIRERLEEDLVPLNILYYALLQISKLLAPVSPHITDKIYCNLKNELHNTISENLKESIHLELLPGTDSSEQKLLDKYINEKLEQEFSTILEVIGAILGARDKANIGIRWPIKEIIVDSSDKKVIEALKDLKEVVLRAVNAKSVKMEKGPVEFEVKTSFRNLGEDFGQETGDVATLIKQKETEIHKEIALGKEEVKLDKFTIKRKHFDIKTLPAKGFSMGEFKQGLVFIKSTLEKEMEPEGFMREVVRRIQVLRKNMELKKQDKIELWIVSQELEKYLNKFDSQISEKVGASNLVISDEEPKGIKDFSQYKVKGKTFKIFAKKL